MRRKGLAEDTIFAGGKGFSLDGEILPGDLLRAENTLAQLSGVFFRGDTVRENGDIHSDAAAPGLTDVYRILVEQIPAIVFIAFFDKSFGEAYVSPQIEQTLGFTQEEWLNDPIRWYQHIHPDDKDRWSSEVAQMLLTGEPLQSVYRILSRDGRTIRFNCEVKIVRHADGHPWFLHGTAFDVTRREHDAEALREYADRMKVLSQSLLDIQESERRRIALELHDQIGQILTGLKLKLEMIARAPETIDGFDEAQELVNELIHRTRELSLDLRPATLDHLGLLAALRRHLRHYRSQTNITVDFKHEGLDGRRFSPEIETAAFRIVQEALTNVARHSGSGNAAVRIVADPKRLTIEIEDNGIGFEPEKALAAGQSNGLTGMRERATLLGGTFKVESNSRRTRLTAEWRLPTLED
ncbi:MAG: PAS domain-containing protein [Pyrinomonadaceae bacterium]